MSKRSFLRMMAGTAYVMVSGRFVTGCKPSNRKLSESELNFLNIQGGFRCQADTARAMDVQSRFGHIIRNGHDQNRALVFAQMALLPDSYLQFLESAVNHSGFHIMFEDPISGYEGAAGLCYGGMNGDTPQWVKLTSYSPSSHYVVLHELGHACHSEAERLSGSGDARAMLIKAYSEAKGSYEGQRTWDYALTNEFEYFAVSVSQFYCSEPARMDMQANYPLAYGLFSRVLQPPPGSGPLVSNNSVVNPGNQTAAAGTAQNQNQPQSQVGGNSQSAGLLAPVVALFRQYYNNQASGNLGLTGLSRPSLLLPREGTVFYAGTQTCIELQAGASDFDAGRMDGYRVRLSLDGGGEKAGFDLKADWAARPYIAERNMMADIRIPDLNQIKKATGSHIRRNKSGEMEIPVLLTVLDPDNRALSSTRHQLKDRHVDFMPPPPIKQHG